MSTEKMWGGDWHERVLARARGLGFRSVSEYVAHRSGVSLLDLATELGAGEVAAAQIRCLLIEEATRSMRIPQMLGDLLAREIPTAIPVGWRQPLDEESRSALIRVISSWYAQLHEFLSHDKTMSAAAALLDAELPDGWLPAGPDDPVIVALVDRCIGRAPS